jgi:hypothetical protein
MCVKLPLTDMSKRKALLEKTGFDIDKAIAMDQADKAEDKIEGIAETNSGRRVKPEEPAATGRRTNGYKIINKDTDTE